MMWCSASCSLISLPNSVGLLVLPFRITSVLGSKRLTILPTTCVLPSKIRSRVCRITCCTRGTKVSTTVVPQLGLSVALLVIAGAHASHTWALSTDAERDAAAKENRAFYATVPPRLGALPGVSPVALSTGLPSRFRILPGLTWVSRDRLEAHAPAVATAARTFVSANFFRVFDIRLLAGRTFDDTRDTPDAPSVVTLTRPSRGNWRRRATRSDC